MTQTLQTKTGVVAFIATVETTVEGVEIAAKGEGFVAIKDGVEIGSVVGETVKFADGETMKKVKLSALVPGIDPATLVGKNFAEMTPAEQAAYVKYLETLAGDKIGATPAATPAKAEKPAKASKAEAATEEGKIPVPTTMEELTSMGVKDQIKLAKQEGVEGITSRTPKKEVEQKLAAALGLLQEDVEEEEAPKSKGKSKVLKSDEELESDEDDEDEEDEDEGDEDSDDDSDDEEDDDSDEDDDDSDEDEDEESDEDDDDSDDEDEDEEEDEEEDDSDEDDDDSDDDDSDEEDEDESDEDDEEEDDEDEEDEEEDDTLAKLRKKWTAKKVDALSTKDEINALRKAVGVTYQPGEKVSPVRVKEDIKAKLFGKGKK